MGTANSKTNSGLTLATTNNHTWRSILKDKAVIYSGWEEIYRCSYTDWLCGISQSFGFIPHKFPCNSELHSICAPGFCSESLSRKLYPNSSRSTSNKIHFSSATKTKKLREHFEYNYIPAMTRSLENYSIRGIVNGGLNHDDIITLLIYSAVLEKTKFILADLKLNHFVCALGKDYNGLVDVKKVYVAWSIDRTQVIIRLPILGGTSVLDFYQIVKKEAKLYRRIVSIDIQAQFQFCPNYCASRLALYTDATQTPMSLIQYDITGLTSTRSNRTKTQVIPLDQPFNGSSLSLMDVHSWSTYKNQNIVFDENFRLLSLQYTPDSVYMILSFADNLCHCRQTFPRSYLEIYHSNSLQRLHRIDPQWMSYICPWHMCRNYLTPIFSLSSSRMAFSTTEDKDAKELQVSIVVLPNEMNLKSICRRLILDYVSELNGKIEDTTIGLPYRLSQYIQYRPEYQ